MKLFYLFFLIKNKSNQKNQLKKLKHKKMVLSSNQALIWETLEKIGMNKSVTGFGKLFSN